VLRPERRSRNVTACFHLYNFDFSCEIKSGPMTLAMDALIG
jgi:hypothetical protein